MTICSYPFFFLIIWRFNYQSSKKLKDKEIAAQRILISAYTKILLNFAQIVSIIGCLNLDWGELFTQLFPFYKIASGNVHQLISYECIISGNFFFVNYKFEHF